MVFTVLATPDHKRGRLLLFVQPIQTGDEAGECLLGERYTGCHTYPMVDGW
jgi:hypothetical protein